MKQVVRVPEGVSVAGLAGAKLPSLFTVGALNGDSRGGSQAWSRHGLQVAVWMVWLVWIVRVRFCDCVFVDQNQVQTPARGPHGVGRDVEPAGRELRFEQRAGPGQRK